MFGSCIVAQSEDETACIWSIRPVSTPSRTKCATSADISPILQEFLLGRRPSWIPFDDSIDLPDLIAGPSHWNALSVSDSGRLEAAYQAYLSRSDSPSVANVTVDGVDRSVDFDSMHIHHPETDAHYRLSRRDPYTVFCSERAEIYVDDIRMFTTGSEVVFFFPPRFGPNRTDRSMLRIFCAETGRKIADWRFSKEHGARLSAFCFDRMRDRIVGYSAHNGVVKQWRNSGPPAPLPGTVFAELECVARAVRELAQCTFRVAVSPADLPPSMPAGMEAYEPHLAASRISTFTDIKYDDCKSGSDDFKADPDMPQLVSVSDAPICNVDMSSSLSILSLDEKLKQHVLMLLAPPHRRLALATAPGMTWAEANRDPKLADESAPSPALIALMMTETVLARMLPLVRYSAVSQATSAVDVVVSDSNSTSGKNHLSHSAVPFAALTSATDRLLQSSTACIDKTMQTSTTSLLTEPFVLDMHPSTFDCGFSIVIDMVAQLKQEPVSPDLALCARLVCHHMLVMLRAHLLRPFSQSICSSSTRDSFRDALMWLAATPASSSGSFTWLVVVAREVLISAIPLFWPTSAQVEALLRQVFASSAHEPWVHTLINDSFVSNTLSDDPACVLRIVSEVLLPVATADCHAPVPRSGGLFSPAVMLLVVLQRNLLARCWKTPTDSLLMRCLHDYCQLVFSEATHAVAAADPKVLAGCDTSAIECVLFFYLLICVVGVPYCLCLIELSVLSI
jgi:hypothetical protein